MAKKELLFYGSRGHDQFTASGVKDPGAVSGKFVEADLVRVVTDAWRDELLRLRGKRKFKVAYPERTKQGMHIWEHLNDVVKYRVKYRTVSIDIHANAGGGIGCECHIPNNKYSKKLAVFIMEAMRKINRPWHSYNGSMDAAIHVNPKLQFLKIPGVTLLFEIGYVDNKTDRKGFDTDTELKEIGKAIAAACIEYFDWVEG